MPLGGIAEIWGAEPKSCCVKVVRLKGKYVRTLASRPPSRRGPSSGKHPNIRTSHPVAPALECSDVRLVGQETRKRVLEVRCPVTVPREVGSLSRMKDDRTNIIVSQQRRDLVFGDWTSATIFLPAGQSGSARSSCTACSDKFPCGSNRAAYPRAAGLEIFRIGLQNLSGDGELVVETWGCLKCFAKASQTPIESYTRGRFESHLSGRRRQCAPSCAPAVEIGQVSVAAKMM